LALVLLDRSPLVGDERWRPPLPGDAAAHGLAAGHALSVLAFAPGRLIRSVGYVHFHDGQVPVVLAVVPTARLVRHQHLGALVRVGHRGRLLSATPPRRLEPDVLGDVPAPVGPVRAARTLERLAVQVSDDVHVEPRSGSRPERAVRALEHLQRENAFSVRTQCII